MTKNASGEHTVSGAVRDDAGNVSARSSLTVKVDATAPQVTLTCPPAPLFLVSAANAQWTATDAHSGLTTPASGSVTLDTSSVGSYTAGAPIAQDNVGYSSTAATCAYSVGYGFEGFFRPVENGGVLNVAKAGQTVPLKWRLTDASGNLVTTLSSAKVTVVALSCSLGSTTDQVEEYVSGSWGLQNLGDGYYQFSWATPKSYANSCKTVHLDLGEGTTHTALFKFTK